jgi:putative FmdB family regulatory protein
MPTYDFQCRTCGKAVRLFISYADYDEANPQCPYCESTDLKRRVSRVALAKSDDARLDGMLDDPSLAGLEDEDPKALGRFMRRMSQDMGEELGEEFDEVVERLESGQSPESIEESMPDLGSDMADDF